MHFLLPVPENVWDFKHLVWCFFWNIDIFVKRHIGIQICTVKFELLLSDFIFPVIPKMSLALLIATHVKVVLVFLSPLGSNWDPIRWSAILIVKLRRTFSLLLIKVSSFCIFWQLDMILYQRRKSINIVWPSNKAVRVYILQEVWKVCTLKKILFLMENHSCTGIIEDRCYPNWTPVDFFSSSYQDPRLSRSLSQTSPIIIHGCRHKSAVQIFFLRWKKIKPFFFSIIARRVEGIMW